MKRNLEWGEFMRRNGLAALAGAITIVGIAPAAHAQDQAPPPATASATARVDPWERLNRFNYAVENGLDKHIIGPLAHVFRALTPGPIGKGLHNALVNLTEPSVLINDVLQLRLKRASVTVRRFVTNSTIGVAGLIDVAAKLGLPHHDNEFGVTLGRYGFYSGPYMFLPLGGPTTVRDLVGSGVDLLLDPFHWIRYAGVAEVSTVRVVVGGLDTRNVTEAELNALLSDATDPYATLRSVYLQNKQSEIQGEEAAPLDLPSFDAPLPTPAPGPTAADTPIAGRMFAEASSPADPDAAQRALNDAAALKLISQPSGLASADLARAAQLGQTLGGVRSLEKAVARQAEPDRLDGAVSPSAAEGADLTVAAAD
jgi:phospholipid-binding lipoprotein MlaA